MATIIFDIETSALPLGNFDDAQREYLFREAEKIADEPARETKRAEIWDVAKHYDSVVTFNGRGFDVPFIYLRSALRNVPISKKNWLGYRYAVEPHCDLAEQFTFYGVSGREGAARRFNLDFYCKAFGIESPKSHGVTGMDVNTLMAGGKFREIAEYCLRDVRATVELYRIWKERLAGIK
jgi:predicted PolB exonuclease-like 3'-5' exonuclease